MKDTEGLKAVLVKIVARLDSVGDQQPEWFQILQALKVSTNYALTRYLDATPGKLSEPIVLSCTCIPEEIREGWFKHAGECPMSDPANRRRR